MDPSEEQRQVLLDLQTVVRSTVVAYDAIALVLHKSNADSFLHIKMYRTSSQEKSLTGTRLIPRPALGLLI